MLTQQRVWEGNLANETTLVCLSMYDALVMSHGAVPSYSSPLCGIPRIGLADSLANLALEVENAAAVKPSEVRQSPTKEEKPYEIPRSAAAIVASLLDSHPSGTQSGFGLEQHQSPEQQTLDHAARHSPEGFANAMAAVLSAVAQLLPEAVPQGHVVGLPDLALEGRQPGFSQPASQSAVPARVAAPEAVHDIGFAAAVVMELARHCAMMLKPFEGFLAGDGGGLSEEPYIFEGALKAAEGVAARVGVAYR
jgi:hypothetical protein